MVGPFAECSQKMHVDDETAQPEVLMQWLADDLLGFLESVRQEKDPDQALIDLLRVTGSKATNLQAVAEEILRIGASATAANLFQTKWATAVIPLIHIYAGPAAKSLVREIYGQNWEKIAPVYKYDRTGIATMNERDKTD